MKKVLFDGLATQGTKDKPFSGGSEYAIFLLKEIIELGYTPDIVFSNRLVTPPSVLSLLETYPKNHVFYVERKEEVYSIIDNNKYDIFYSALPMQYRKYRGTAKFICVIHGLRSVELPWDDFRYVYEHTLKGRIGSKLINLLPVLQQRLKRKHINQYADLLNNENNHVIVVSNHTKYALLNFFPNLKENRVSVFYSPQKIIIEPIEGGNYFLMVNGNRYEKNTYRAIQVFDKLFSEGRLEDKKVIITGCGKQKFFTDMKNKERFDCKPYVSSEELEELYKNAFCFVYPSLNEGFGYPPVKAMGYGTPVIASSATSIPEVCDDAALYFSPTNMDDMANRILQIYYDDNLRNRLVNRGLQRIRSLRSIQENELSRYINTIFI